MSKRRGEEGPNVAAEPSRRRPPRGGAHARSTRRLRRLRGGERQRPQGSILHGGEASGRAAPRNLRRAVLG